MNERIKKVRKFLDLTQQEFGKRIGTTANVLTNYETGRRNPSSSVINNICKEFNINENWLRTGEGDMFAEVSKDEQISDFVNKILSQESSSFKRRFISLLSRLSEPDWEVLERMVVELAEGGTALADMEIAEEPAPDISVVQAISPVTSDKEIDAEVEEYRRQLYEEKEAAEKSKALRDIKEA